MLWALQEYDFEFEVTWLDLFKGETRSEAFLALNPAAKIPVLAQAAQGTVEQALQRVKQALQPVWQWLGQGEYLLASGFSQVRLWFRQMRDGKQGWYRARQDK